MAMIECVQCGKQFKKGDNRKTCSVECAATRKREYQREYQRRNKVAKPRPDQPLYRPVRRKCKRCDRMTTADSYFYCWEHKRIAYQSTHPWYMEGIGTESGEWWAEEVIDGS